MTDEATNADDFRDTTWFKEIEEIYQSFSLIIDDRYKPGTKKEIDHAKIKVEELKKKHKGNKDFNKEIKYLDDLLVDSGKRRFNGSKFTIIGVFLGILVMFYMSNRVEEKSGDLSIDKAESIQLDKIVKLERKIKSAKDEIEYSMTYTIPLKKEIEDLKKQEQSNQIIERIAAKEKNLASSEENNRIRETTISESKKQIEFLKSMSAEEYRDYKIGNDQEAADSVSGYAWKTILWFLLYLSAMFPFVFTIDKRGKKDKSKWLKIIGAILGSAQTVRYRRSDGSTYDDNSSYIGAFATAIALPVAAIALTIVLLPYIATIAFVRNIIVPYFY
ncbi:hypothetical protein [Lentimicrobium sp. S6]|uniref:hypothetical protein n=1 Tax=Lentimicrobium sp. S6 TaxID=2735872 RepID=UPI0015556ED9|nr:hypothetical protein [Lentimicrobium sp. S6]NPD45613.1 hypothetical protein [Lentimicrobium sp. S6]